MSSSAARAPLWRRSSIAIVINNCYIGISCGRLSAGYYNLTHPSQPLSILPPGEAEHSLVWNAAVGMRQPDDKLREAIDEALDRLRAGGLIDKIYAKYGISLPPPR